MHKKFKVAFSALSLSLLSVFAFGFLPTSSFAQPEPVVLGTETSDGIVVAIPNSDPILTVASDGEGSFDPFGFGADTSDGIQLNANWVPNNSDGAFNTGFWTQIPGTFTWVLPAVTPCGAENEPACEPLGSWYFPGAFWQSGVTPDYMVILEPDGSISDQIWANNDGPGGSAQILFWSDPGPAPVPEPSTFLLLGAGLAGVGLLRKRFKS